LGSEKREKTSFPVKGNMPKGKESLLTKKLGKNKTLCSWKGKKKVFLLIGGKEIIQ